MKMEENISSVNNSDGVRFGIGEAWAWVPSRTHWCCIASAAQLGWGIRSCKKGFVGDSNFMPARAFGVASLFVGAAATAFFAALNASGIHTVEDMREAGANIRKGMRVPPRNKAE
ncbi:uncharacterized protein [Spinacia oleracea]|uniref:Uncharacterized protein LOC110802829 n=1 Tax=Spinacia oleracea TaxID=3562 RepID=A0A9R0J9Y6_SPIOL|nr:uncharacterized protein LOC110802829 isoform X2 [Spinacia oleracea]XP_056693452.1 uncharacterized protein LOC110802829 isoform X2 [Spinacia oleracea]